MKPQHIAFIAGAIFLISLLFFFTREDAKILAYEGEDKFSFIDPSELPRRHVGNFNKLKQALANKGHRGVRMNFLQTGKPGGEGRCRHGTIGHHQDTCQNPNNDCREAIVWCPAGGVAAATRGGHKPPCKCVSLHTSFSGYHYNPV